MTASERLLDVLGTFDLSHRAQTVEEIAQRLDQPPSSVYRSVKALREAGYLGASQDGVYRLQPKILQLAAVARADNSLVRCSRGPLQQLTQRTRQTSMITVRTDRWAVCLDSVASGQSIGITIPPGKLLPLHAGATSRVLLAYLSETERRAFYTEHPLEALVGASTEVLQLENELSVVRARGWDMTDGQFEAGIYSCAVPIFDVDSVAIASISVVGISSGLENSPESFLPSLKEAASQIEGQL